MSIEVILMQMLQLFMFIGLGYFLFKIKLLDVELNKRLTTLLLSVTTPALILSSVLNTKDYLPLSDIAFVFIVGLVVFMLLPVVSYFMVKIMRVPISQQGLYIFMCVFSNIGFMGFPIMKSIYGNDAVFYTAIFNMIFNILVFTVGILIMNYGTATKIQLNAKNLVSPAVVSSLCALLIYIFHIQFPQIIITTVGQLGDMTTPLAMLVIGSTLANIPIKEVFSEFRIYPFTFIKQIIIPIIAYPFLRYFISDPLILGVTLIMLAMPVGNIAVLFATEYDRDVSLAAKAVFMTTLLSIVTIPFIVALFLV